MSIGSWLIKRLPHILCALLMAASIIPANILQNAIKKNQKEREQLNFKILAAQRAHMIVQLLQTTEERLDTLRRFFNASEYVSKAEFRAFTSSWLQKQSYLSFYSTEAPLFTPPILNQNLIPIDSELYEMPIEPQVSTENVALELILLDITQQARQYPESIHCRIIHYPRPLLIISLYTHSQDSQVVVLYAILDIQAGCETVLDGTPYVGLPFCIHDPENPEKHLYYHAPRLDASLSSEWQDEECSQLALYYDSVIQVSNTPLHLRITVSEQYLKLNTNTLYRLSGPILVLIVWIGLLIVLYLFLRLSKTEKDRRELSNDLHFFYRINADMQCIGSIEGKFLSINQAWQRSLGYTEKDLLGKNFLIHVHPEDKEITIQKITELENHGQIIPLINRIQAADGSWKTLEWRSSRYGNKVYASARDISERVYQEKQMQQNLKEKEILLKEIHHRVKNNLQIVSSMLNLQAHESEDQQLREAIDIAQGRIRTMALIHEKLYSSNDFSSINFKEYAQALVSMFQSQLKERFIQVEFSCEDLFLDIGESINLGLILNELLANSAKYSFTVQENPLIQISLHVRQDIIELIVEDNGCGYPENFDIESHSGLGLRLVQSLSKQLDPAGHITLGKSPKLGGAMTCIGFSRSTQ